MPEPKDHTKLQKFVEAALTNPRHPVYPAMRHSPILQHYALNVKGVGLLNTIEAKDWFEQYPLWTERLEQVMTMCETEAAEQADAGSTETTTQLKAENTRLQARIAELENTAPAAAPEAK